MKKLILLISLCVLTFSLNAQIRWPFGDANAITGGTNDTVDISSELTRGLNYYIITNDTNMVINVTTASTSWKKGDLLIIEATEGTAVADTIRYGTNITGLEDAIPSGKTRISSFIWNATAWVKFATVQID
jgi:hypothetical protein